MSHREEPRLRRAYGSICYYIENEPPPSETLLSNNHIDNFDFFLSTDYTLKTSIDKIVLTFSEYDRNDICSHLKLNGFKLKSVRKLKKGKFQWKSNYNDGYLEIDMVYGKRDGLDFKSVFLLTIHEPNKDILSWLDRLHINYLLTNIEIAYDFYIDYPASFKLFLDNILFLRYQSKRKPSFFYKSTSYTTDLRTAAKGTRTYIKEINGEKVVRLELNLNQRIIKRLGLTLPLDSIDSLNPFQFFRFMALDTGKVLNYLLGTVKDDIAALNLNRPGMGGLVKSHVNSWMHTYLMWVKSLMKQVEALKRQGIPNHGRFRKALPDFSQRFMEKVSAQDYIPSGQKTYHTGE
jgi:hypothetical protein